MHFLTQFLIEIAHAAVTISTAVPGTAPADTPGGIVANVYQFALSIGGVCAFGAIVYGGIKYSLAAGNPTKQSDARDQILQAFYGILLLLGAYLILNIIDPNLVNFGLPELGGVTAVAPGLGLPPTPTGGLTEDAARAQLAAAGIDVNKPPPGTTLAGMKQETLDEILAMKRACGCAITVTGGTEHGLTPGYSHGQGYKFDLGLNSKLDSYIENPANFKRIGTRSDGAPLYWKPGTATYYAKESNHWDVVVKPRA